MSLKTHLLSLLTIQLTLSCRWTVVAYILAQNIGPSRTNQTHPVSKASLTNPFLRFSMIRYVLGIQ